MIIFFLSLLLFSGAAATDEGWIDAIKGSKIEFDLERTPLQIKTIQGEDVVSVWFYDESETTAGRIFLRDLTSSSGSLSPPEYEIYDCMPTQNFPDHFVLPINSDNVWTITKKSPGPRITVQCNEVTVVDVTLSEMCTTSYWKPAWSKNVAKIEFRSNDKASKYYRPKPLGNERLIHFYFEVRFLRVD
ncbi:uncharacterized protein LOC134824512 [Bolinopsis microptera]|uniref:uncharacterized protein LOC134824512 n=1 Tax=Bolinopsis microptera TaxID=2820187 RepID=UPI003078C2CD